MNGDILATCPKAYHCLSLVAERAGCQARLRPRLHDCRGPLGTGRSVRVRGPAAGQGVQAIDHARIRENYGALLQVVREGQPGGTIVFVWRRVDGEWRLVSYRAVD